MATQRPTSTTCRRIAANFNIKFDQSASGFGGNIFKASLHSKLMMVKKVIDTEEMERMRALAENDKHKHESIVSFIIVDDSLDHIYIAMPRYCGTLLDIAYPVDDVGLCKIIDCIFGALVHLHSCGFCHMDVKATNICLTDTGRAILIDLGSTTTHDCWTPVTERNVPTDMHNIIKRGQMQAKPKIDIWMFAITIYFLLRGGNNVTPKALDCVKFLIDYSNICASTASAIAPLLDGLQLHPIADSSEDHTHL